MGTPMFRKGWIQIPMFLISSKTQHDQRTSSMLAISSCSTINQTIKCKLKQSQSFKWYYKVFSKSLLHKMGTPPKSQKELWRATPPWTSLHRGWRSYPVLREVFLTSRSNQCLGSSSQSPISDVRWKSLSDHQSNQQALSLVPTSTVVTILELVHSR